MRRLSLLAAILAAALLAVPTGSARADSTPVGRLPAGPVQTITAKKGQLVAVALPKASERSGLVWRIARAYDSDVVRQAEEADVGERTVVVVFRAVGAGRTSVIFAQTRGDSSPRAVRALRFRLRIT
jgi:hypothetical protein